MREHIGEQGPEFINEIQSTQRQSQIRCKIDVRDITGDVYAEIDGHIENDKYRKVTLLPESTFNRIKNRHNLIIKITVFFPDHDNDKPKKHAAEVGEMRHVIHRVIA
jgi:hypothetical protein